MRVSSARNEGRSCLICKEPSEGANSGVESCRACSAFFRRSILENLAYACKAESACELKRGEKRMCRACRFSRCLAVGMLPEHVRGGSTATAPQEPALILNDPGPSSRPDETEAFLDENSSRIPLLAKIGSLYHLSRSRRFYSELTMLPRGAKKPSNSDAVEAQQLHPCDVKLADNLWKSNLAFITEFCTEAFEEFRVLEQSDKFNLFRSFIATLFIFELEEATSKFGLQKERKRQMSRTTYIDFDHPELFFTDRESSADDKFLKGFAESCADPGNCRHLESFRRLDLSVVERAAVIALLFWNVDDLDMPISDDTLAVCNSMRARVMRDLHVYYKDLLRLDDYCLRLGKLLDLLLQTVAHARGMRTELMVYVMMGAMTRDLTLFDLIRV